MVWIILWANKWEDYSNYFGGRGRHFQELGHCPVFWPLMVSLGTAMAPVSMSFSMLMCYNEHVMSFKIYWKLNLLPS